MINNGRGMGDETWAQYITHKLTVHTKQFIAESCGVSQASVDRWAAGLNAPIPVVQTMIREVL